MDELTLSEIVNIAKSAIPPVFRSSLSLLWLLITGPFPCEAISDWDESALLLLLERAIEECEQAQFALKIPYVKYILVVAERSEPVNLPSAFFRFMSDAFEDNVFEGGMMIDCLMTFKTVITKIIAGNAEMLETVAEEFALVPKLRVLSEEESDIGEIAKVILALVSPQEPFVA
jgi:hypothetical protein